MMGLWEPNDGDIIIKNDGVQEPNDGVMGTK